MLKLVKTVAGSGAARVRVARQFCSWPGLSLLKLTHLELTSFL